MDEMMWEIEVAYEEDPEDALLEAHRVTLEDMPITPRELLDKVLRDLPKTIAEIKAEDHKPDVPPPEELAEFESLLDKLRPFDKAFPQDVAGEIQLVRDMYEGAANGIGNALDIVDFSDRLKRNHAWLINANQMKRWFGTTKPHFVSDNAHEDIGHVLRPHQAIAFPLYEDDEAVAWCFIGISLV